MTSNISSKIELGCTRLNREDASVINFWPFATDMIAVRFVTTCDLCDIWGRAMSKDDDDDHEEVMRMRVRMRTRMMMMMMMLMLMLMLMMLLLMMMVWWCGDLVMWWCGSKFKLRKGNNRSDRKAKVGSLEFLAFRVGMGLFLFTPNHRTGVPHVLESDVYIQAGVDEDVQRACEFEDWYLPGS